MADRNASGDELETDRLAVSRGGVANPPVNGSDRTASMTDEADRDTENSAAFSGMHLNAPLADHELDEHDAGALPTFQHVGIGQMLEPVLQQECQGRLSSISWFRTDWQRGGAVTGYATFTEEDIEHPVVVKLPVPPCERHWLVELQQTEHVVPRVFAHGDAIGSYDLAWVVMERMPCGPLGAAWQGAEFDLLIETIGRFYKAAAEVPLHGKPRQRDWQAIYQTARQRVKAASVPEHQRWNNALKKAGKKLDKWIDAWQQRPIDGWVHGDLHLANAMTRKPAPAGPALLFDFALTRIGNWVEDAIYFEHLYWAKRDRLNGRKLASLIAKQRKAHDLPVDADWAQLAEVERALLAMSVPARLGDENKPQHIAAALEVLERSV